MRSRGLLWRRRLNCPAERPSRLPAATPIPLVGPSAPAPNWPRITPLQHPSLRGAFAFAAALGACSGNGAARLRWRNRLARRCLARHAASHAAGHEAPGVGEPSLVEARQTLSDSCRRHLALGLAVGLAGGGGALGAPPGARAAITGSLREAVSDFTTSMGGAPGDIYYPKWFLGDWQVASELVAVETPQGESVAGEEALRARALVGSPGAVKRFPLRFKEYRGKVIGDREYNVRLFLEDSNGVDVVRSVESTEWDPTNANVLSAKCTRGDGLRISKEFYVRARSTGVPEGRDDLFNASEFYQDILAGRIGGPAAVSPRRRVTKFKRVTGPEIQLVERVEVFPALSVDGAPNSGAFSISASDAGKPSAIYKYRGILTAA